MSNEEASARPPEPSAPRSRIALPAVPIDQQDRRVAAWSEPLMIDTYMPTEPSAYPAFLDRRVYQGSSGKVFPLPFHERIANEKVAHRWEALHLENEWVRLVILPELGGRIHVGYDKVADYDFFYRNNVIKPALVGLAGPWISGGVEFNWPQHHRPATFLPVDWEIEQEADGSTTIWCSDHDPMNRMKGMHGIRLRPDSIVIEARVRLYNRTDETQTFLWWANVAAAVNDDYQSFFPTDVSYVADHAKRAVATYPRVAGLYYGVDYSARVTTARPDGDRLDWYRNIPVPTSYMVTGTQDDFFGGYDHGREAGFVHWADRSVAPGKKQWTWGNDPFGWAWDANLTDGDGPYVELMAGVYTDNQPDFSWMAPGETKTFSQYWYPIRNIGPAQQANLDIAVRVDSSESATRIAIVATRSFPGALVTVEGYPPVTVDLAPGEPYISILDASPQTVLEVSHRGQMLIRWGHGRPPAPEPVAAKEPPLPSEIESTDELIMVGLYLEQYRHATRNPSPYWEETIRRDPDDSRAHVALARALTRAGLFADAETHLRVALARITAWVPNPSDGEAHYRLGIVLTHQDRDDEAAEAFAKAQWNAPWRVASGFALARLRARAGDLAASEAALREVLALDSRHSQSRALLATVVRATGRTAESDEMVAGILRDDPLDQWARDLAGGSLTRDAPTLLDIGIEYAQSGFNDDALRLFGAAALAATRTALGQVQIEPIAHYHAAVIHERGGDVSAAADARAAARAADTTHCLPSRLLDIDALERAEPEDVTASLLLGSWYYDKGRAEHAVRAWTRATATQDPRRRAVAHRNLGIAAYNWSRSSSDALKHYEAARAAVPDDAKVLFEYDQLLARMGRAGRLDLLEKNLALVAERDDLTIEYVRLLVADSRAEHAREVMLSRRFQPWEGGEGLVLSAWESVNVSLYALALTPEAAADHIQSALAPPASLGEARHPLANAANLFTLLGDVRRRLGNEAGAREAWRVAANFTGDFRDMSTQPFSEQTLFSIRALRSLGESAAALALTRRLMDYVEDLATSPARVDYFATSLPTMLLFHDDPQEARDRHVARLREQIAALMTEHPLSGAVAE